MNNFYLIGLTGNLGSGKSTVRRQLEDLGAYGIDADLVAHSAMRRGSSAWFAILGEFGLGVLTPSGQINRQKLAARVFENARALERLENILHPAVAKLIKEGLRKVDAPVVVIEAVKLIEAGLHEWCDAVWVVTCDPKVEVERVAASRHMRVEDAWARLAAQGPLDEKLALATVVIDNSGDAEATRAQVQQAWDAIRSDTARDKQSWLYGKMPAAAVPTPVVTPELDVDQARATHQERGPSAFEIRRAHKSDLEALEVAFAKHRHTADPLSRAETLERFGAHGYGIAVSRGRVAAFVAWDAENLVALAHEMWAEDAAARRAIPQILTMIEGEARQLQCEVLLTVIDPRALPLTQELAPDESYRLRNLRELHPVWRRVASERAQPEEQILVKLLREELVTQPF